MHLKKTPAKTGRISLPAVQGYRNNGRVRQKTVKAFGFAGEPEKGFDGPIAHSTQVVAKTDAHSHSIG